MIYKTITDKYEFSNWIANSNSYRSKFSFEGANAIQNYYETLSDELEDGIEYDPIAWCCEWSEFDSYAEIWEQYGNGTNFIENEELANDTNIKQWLEERTTVAELENSILIINF